DQSALDDLMDKLVALRHQVALNADFKNFRDYQFAALHRFDYGPQDCEAFHQSIREKVVPLTTKRLEKRRKEMGLETLRPYDLSVDPKNQPALSPFKTSDEFLEKSIQCLNRIDPSFGALLAVMGQDGYLDLDSRKGKAPGGFNYSLNESGIPFIYMNASGRHQDIETMIHEAGHAVHALIDAQHIDFTPARSTPAEVAEVASMGLELISMGAWDIFYPDPQDLKRAQIEKLEDILASLPAVAKVDSFQHWLYLNPDHTPETRAQKWMEIEDQYSSRLIDQTGYEDLRKIVWQRILHIFEVPFYYVEYGFAQLGAVALWRHYLQDPQKALEAYKSFMQYGYTLTIPELYEKAGIKFDFSPQYIGELMDFVEVQLQKLED
ncbi:MAG TPA: M3 family oligoendopeptidase, partial [Candidatus Gracilibacteria bacterium]